MRKLIAIIIAAALALSLAACSAAPQPEEPAPAAEPTPVPSTAPEAEAPVSDNAAVYFTSDISPEGLMAVYEALAWQPEGSVAVKLSTGEPPASNYLDPALIKDLVQSVSGTIVSAADGA